MGKMARLILDMFSSQNYSLISKQGYRKQKKGRNGGYRKQKKGINGGYRKQKKGRNRNTRGRENRIKMSQKTPKLKKDQIQC